MNASSLNPRDLTVAQFLALFNKFSRSEQTKIARKIWEKIFAEQWKALDAELPDADMPEEEILHELRAVRYGETTKN